MEVSNPFRRSKEERHRYNDWGNLHTYLATGTVYPVHYAPELGSASVLAPSKIQAQLEFESKLRAVDWDCIYCRRTNPGTEYECLGCGAGRLINKMNDEELIAAARRFLND